MMGQQVGLRAGQAAQLDGGAIRADQFVDDRQPDRVTQRSVPRGTRSRTIGCSTTSTTIVSQL